MVICNHLYFCVSDRYPSDVTHDYQKVTMGEENIPSRCVISTGWSAAGVPRQQSAGENQTCVGRVDVGRHRG
jgi:hypothetical protein